MTIIHPKKERRRDSNGELLSDQWETPWELVQEGLDFFGITDKPTIDVFASEHNSKAPLFITREMNALITDWNKFAADNEVEPFFWANPPYSQGVLGKAVKKMWDTSLAGGRTLAILPANTSPKWYHLYVKPLAEGTNREFLEGRRKFLPPPGMADPGRPSGDNIWVYFTPTGVKEAITRLEQEGQH